MPELESIFTIGNKVPAVPQDLLRKFQYISIEPNIRSGWPHIKGTRILVTDIFKAQIKGNSSDAILRDFKHLNIQLTKTELEEACSFTIEWLHYLHGKEAQSNKN